SDPFGLCPPKDDVPCRDVTSEEGRKILHAAAETGQWTWTEGKTEEGQIPKDVPNHVGDCTDFCETAQENAGLAALDPRPSTRDFAGSSDFRSLVVMKSLKWEISSCTRATPAWQPELSTSKVARWLSRMARVGPR